MNHYIVPNKWEYYIIKNEPKPNKFIESTKKALVDFDNLEDLHNRNKLTNECYESVKETMETRYRTEVYLLLNNKW